MLDDQKELFIVVDENDNIVEYRTRYDCHHNKNLIHRAVGVIIYNSKKEILLQKRSMLKDLYPGKYTISVGGHVTKGQNYKEAAKREMQEELGINVPIEFVKKYIMENDHETEMDVLFEGKCEGPFFPVADEVESVKFFSKKQIKQMKDQLTSFAWQTFQQINLV